MAEGRLRANPRRATARHACFRPGGGGPANFHLYRHDEVRPIFELRAHYRVRYRRTTIRLTDPVHRALWDDTNKDPALLPILRDHIEDDGLLGDASEARARRAADAGPYGRGLPPNTPVE